MVFRRLWAFHLNIQDLKLDPSCQVLQLRTTNLKLFKIRGGWWYLWSQIWLNLVAEFRWVGNGVKDPASNSSVRSVNASPLKKNIKISQPHNSTSRRWVSLIRVKEKRRHSDSESNTFATRPFIFPGPPCSSSIWPHRPHKPRSNGGLQRKPAAKEWFGQPMPWSSTPKGKHPNDPIVNLAVRSTLRIHRHHPNGLGIARRIGPNRCPKNFEPDAGWKYQWLRNNYLHVSLKFVFTSFTNISHICEYTSYFS